MQLTEVENLKASVLALEAALREAKDRIGDVLLGGDLNKLDEKRLRDAVALLAGRGEEGKATHRHGGRKEG